MKISACILLMLLTSLCIAQRSPPEENTNTAHDFTGLDTLLKREALKNGGMALVLVKDGIIIYDKGFSGMTSDTVIPIASATKWLSAAVIMALVDEGVLSLDDKASQYLKNYTGAHGDMTVRQMFSHTSGLPGHHSSTGLPGSDDIVGNRKITLRESVDMIAELELLADPGTQFYYGGLSMQVAGRIAEVASGKDWLTLFEEKVAQPLGMERTDYNGLGLTTNPRIAGSIQTSAHQYVQFLSMLLGDGVYEGTRVLSPSAINEIFHDQTFGVPIVSSPWQTYEHLLPGEVRYGIGCWLEATDETGNAREASSQGAFGFSPWIDRDRNLAGVLAVKSRLTRVMPVYLEMKDLIKEIIDGKETFTLQDSKGSFSGLYPDHDLCIIETDELHHQRLKSEKGLCYTKKLHEKILLHNL